MARPKEKTSRPFEQRCSIAELKMRQTEAEKLASDMKTLLVDGTFADFSIVGISSLGLHNFIIRARSSELMTHLEALQDTRDQTVHLKGCNDDKLREIFKSLYSEDNITRVLVEVASLLDSENTSRNVDGPTTSGNDCLCMRGCCDTTFHSGEGAKSSDYSNNFPAEQSNNCDNNMDGDVMACGSGLTGIGVSHVSCETFQCTNNAICHCNMETCVGACREGELDVIARQIVLQAIEEAKRIYTAMTGSERNKASISGGITAEKDIGSSRDLESVHKHSVPTKSDVHAVHNIQNNCSGVDTCHLGVTEDIHKCENSTELNSQKIDDRKNKKKTKVITIHTSQELRTRTLQTLLKQKYGVTGSLEACGGLGEDLLCGLLQDNDCDCMLQVQGKHLPAHRCVLAARSSYFNAMLCGSWRESDQQVISLEGVDINSVLQLLLYVYGGITDLLPGTSISALVMMSDMYNLQSLKDVLMFHLRKDFCHFFHKPCQACISGVPDTLTLAMMYNMDVLKDPCLKWISRHFSRVWPTRSFVSLPQEVLELCITATVQDLAVNSVINTMVELQRLNDMTPHLKWTEPVFDMITRFMDAAIEYASQNFLNIITSEKFRQIDQGGLPFDQTSLEAIFGLIIEALSPGLACEAYTVLSHWQAKFQACKSDEDKFAIYSQEFQSFVVFLHERNKSHLCRYLHQATNTVEWGRLCKQDQDQLIAEANYIFIDKPAKAKISPPKLTSMQKKISTLSMQEYFDKHCSHRDAAMTQPKITILKNERQKGGATGTSKPGPTLPRQSKSTANTKSQTKPEAGANIHKIKNATGVLKNKNHCNVGNNNESSIKNTKASEIEKGTDGSLDTQTELKSVDQVKRKKVLSTENVHYVARGKKLHDQNANELNKSNESIAKKTGTTKRINSSEKLRKSSINGVNGSCGLTDIRKAKSKEPLDVYARAYKKTGHKAKNSKSHSRTPSIDSTSHVDGANGDFDQDRRDSEVSDMSPPFVSTFGRSGATSSESEAPIDDQVHVVFTDMLIPFLTVCFYTPS